MISSGSGWRLIFEPFHSRKIDFLRDWNYRQYLRPGDRDQRFAEPATRILTGKLRHPLVDRFNGSFLARRRLVKEIRANVLLPWLHSAFPEISIVLLLRHSHGPLSILRPQKPVSEFG